MAKTNKKANKITPAQKSKSDIEKVSAQISQHPIGYKGNVTLKLYKGDKLIKTLGEYNSGTMRLFSGIAKFLSGAFNNISVDSMDMYIPQFLGVGCEVGTELTPTDPTMYRLYNEYDIGSRIKMTPGPITVSTDAQYILVPLIGTISYSDIGSSRITELGLFSGIEPGNNDMLARVNINTIGADNQRGIVLDVGLNLAIEWDIVIRNV